MRGSSIFHLTLGTLVVLIAGAAGQVARLEQRPVVSGSSWEHSGCRAPKAQYPNSSSYTPTWRLTDGATSPARLIVKFRTGFAAGLALRLVRELLPTSPQPSV